MSAKFPRIPHLPFSPGATPDDERLTGVDNFLKKPVVLTEKMDGAQVCLTHETVYARSHSGPAQGPMFDELKAYHATVRNRIPEGISVFAEWCGFVHSIRYEAEDFPRLFIIAIRADWTRTWANWETTYFWAGCLGAAPVPRVLMHQFEDARTFEKVILAMAESPSKYGGATREGIVVRPVDGVTDSEVAGFFGKYVRNDFQAGETLDGPLVEQPGKIWGTLW